MVKILTFKLFFHFLAIFSASKRLYLSRSRLTELGKNIGPVPWTQKSTETHPLENEWLIAFLCEQRSELLLLHPNPKEVYKDDVSSFVMVSSAWAGPIYKKDLDYSNWAGPIYIKDLDYSLFYFSLHLDSWLMSHSWK